MPARLPLRREDPGYRGDNVVYLCRSLSLTPLRHQQNRPAEDSGLRCAERHQYTIAFAEPEPWRSQAMKPSFSNFSRSSFNMSIQYVKQKSQMRLPRGLRSDTESKTESELSSCESTEVGCLSGLASEVVSSCKQSCCMRYLAHRVRPTRKTFRRTRRHGATHDSFSFVTTSLRCRCGPIPMDGSMPPRRCARRGGGQTAQEADAPDGCTAVIPYCLDRLTKRISDCYQMTAGSARTSTT